MGKFFKKYYLFLALAALAFIIHFSFLTYPSEVVFDEVHFGKFVSGYFTGEYFFDIHPPLGKLMIAGFGKMTGLDTASFIPSAGSADTATSIGFDHIGEPLPPQILFTLRFLPALFGALFVLAFSWLAWLASNSKTASLIAGFLALADHAFLVQSKFILVDIFLLFFTVLAFCFFFLWQRQKSWSCKWFLYLILAAVSFGFSISIKWTAVATLGIFAVVLFAKIFSSRLANYLSKTNASRQKKLIEGLVGLVFILIIASLLYAGFFKIHFDLLPKPGPGSAFMSWQFQQELKYGKQDSYERPSFTQKFLELNQTMYTASAGITTEHPYGSRWHIWPLDEKWVYYWNEDQPQKSAKIYFFGNPIIWWLAGAGVLATIIAAFRKKWWQKIPPVFYILALAYLANLLPFIFIKRVSFLYHYLPSAVFAALLLAFWLAKLWTKEKFLVGLLLAIIALAFIALLPLAYGWPMPTFYFKFF